MMRRPVLCVLPLLVLAGLPAAPAGAATAYAARATWSYAPGYNPEAITVSAAGVVYVVGQDDKVRSYDGNGVQVGGWDLPFHSILGGVDTDPAGNVVISDGPSETVHVYSPTGAPVRTYGAGPADPDTYIDVDVGADGTAYVLDLHGAKVHRFAPDGTYLGSWGVPGAGPGQISGAFSLAIGRDGLVYVANTDNQRISVFTTAGQLVREWTTTVAGAPTSPTEVQLLASGDVLVLDTYVAGVREFSATGAFVQDIGVAELRGLKNDLSLDAAGGIYVAGDRVGTTDGVVAFAPAVAPVVAAAAGAVTVAAKARVAKGRLGVTFTCAGGAVCAGRAVVTGARAGNKAGKKKPVLARGSYGVAAGASATVMLRLTKAGRRTLTHRRESGGKVRVTATLSPTTGGSTKAAVRVKPSR